MSEYCKGCVIFEYCNYSKYNKNGVCPCTNCLIKMVCENTGDNLCDDWKKPTKEVQKFKDKQTYLKI